MKYKINSISINSRGLKLDGQLYIPTHKKEEKLPAVVFYQGRGCHYNKYAKWMAELARRDIVGLIYDLGGIGESDGEFSEQTISDGYEDAVAGIEYLTGLDFVDMERIGVFGGSYGGYLGSILATSGPLQVKSLVLEAPANFPDELWEKVPENQVGDEKDLFIETSIFHNTKAIRLIKGFKGNLMVICHGEDDLLPEGIVKMFYDSSAKAGEKKYQVLKGAPHSLTGFESLKSEAARICGEWMEETLQ